MCVLNFGSVLLFNHSRDLLQYIHEIKYLITMREKKTDTLESLKKELQDWRKKGYLRRLTYSI